MTGRPTTYREELADHICREIAEGKSVRKILKEPGMPVISTLFRWLIKNQEFSKQYLEAKSAYADPVFDAMIDLSDEVAEEAQAVSKARLQVETRKWVVGGLNPKKYGERLQHDDQLIRHEVRVIE